MQQGNDLTAAMGKGLLIVVILGLTDFVEVTGWHRGPASQEREPGLPAPKSVMWLQSSGDRVYSRRQPGISDIPPLSFTDDATTAPGEAPAAKIRH